MKKHSISVVTLLAALLILSSCSIGNTGETSTQSSSAPPSTFPSEVTTTEVTTQQAFVSVSTFAYNNEKPPEIGTPDKIEVIAYFRVAMGKKPFVLTKKERAVMVDLLNSQTLRGYDYEKSQIVQIDGGGVVVTLYYSNQKKVVYNVISKDQIIIGDDIESRGPYFMNDSENQQKLDAYLISILMREG